MMEKEVKDGKDDKPTRRRREKGEEEEEEEMAVAVMQLDWCWSQKRQDSRWLRNRQYCCCQRHHYQR